MSQSVMDRQSRGATPAEASASAGYGASSYPVPAQRPNTGNRLSISALVSALAGIALATVPLIVSGMPRGVALAAVSAGLVLGVLATLLGALGRGRAVGKGVGMAGLVLGILALAWTIGGFACTIW